MTSKPILEYQRFDLTNFLEYDEGTFPHDYEWVHTKYFRLQFGAVADHLVSAGVIADPQFADDYVGPYAENPERHGKWWRHRIGPADYHQVDADQATELFDEWLGRVDLMPPRLRERLTQLVLIDRVAETVTLLVGTDD